MNNYQLFLSHSSNDSKIVNAFADFMIKIGLTNKNLFCSSSPYTKISIKTDIYDYLNKLLSNDLVYVIYFLSDNYYSSPVCLNEMGATWLKKSESLNILLPGFDYKDIQGVVNKNAIGIKLGTSDSMIKASFNELKKDLVQMFNIQIEDTLWETARDEFLRTTIENPRNFNMSHSNSYCINDLDNDGCKIIRKESNRECIVANVDFNKTDSKLCSIVVFTGEQNFINHFINRRNICFEAYADEGINLIELELHLNNINIPYDIYLTNDVKTYKIPLDQFTDELYPWKKVSEIAFLIRKSKTKNAGKITIKNLHIE